jgi:cell fate (sporulation/competence/biofilm development) regulator YlbF (YheA/YmcA/DUF963 family)
MEAHAALEAAVANSSELPSEQISLPAELWEATSMLIGNLVQSEPFLRFKEAEKTMKEDKGASRILSDFNELQRNLRAKQLSGPISEEDIKQLRAFQGAIYSNAIIQDYLQAQATAVAFLQEVNTEISQLLGVDFASLVRKPGVC